MNAIRPLPSGTSKPDGYRLICEQLAYLLKEEPDFLANAANTVSLLYHTLPDVHWVGFYFTRGKTLFLGPFQGKPACTRIDFNAGVCGTAAVRNETIVVPDVEKFPGHIVCDPDSRSEIAVPLLNWGRLLGVLDLDSLSPNRFDDDDREGLETLAALFLSSFSTNDLPDLEALANNVNA
jgi:L-methionine (R)-S-oxide reductase